MMLYRTEQGKIESIFVIRESIFQCFRCIDGESALNMGPFY